MDISVVIPCYNESESIAPLAHRLGQLLVRLGPGMASELIFVDDGSTDDTHALLKQTYTGHDHVLILKHSKNRGLGAAIRTGIEHATGRFVATIDSDCTYDPLIIPDMLAIMGSDVDIVTASPYAPRGQTLHVAPYQRFISESCSKLYKMLLRSDVHTFTSMFRIYRRSSLDILSFHSDSFLCMSEILVSALAHNLRVEEFATVLRGREYGYSKRKIMRLTIEHLKLMGTIVWKRLWRSPS